MQILIKLRCFLHYMRPQIAHIFKNVSRVTILPIYYFDIAF